MLDARRGSDCFLEVARDELGAEELREVSDLEDDGFEKFRGAEYKGARCRRRHVRLESSKLIESCRGKWNSQVVG